MNKEKTLKNSIIDFMQSIVIALAVSIFLYLFVITPSEVEGSSMEPNFHTGERLYTNKLTHWFSNTAVGRTLGLDYDRGEIVVFQKPGMDALIKRVIAVPGDTIEVKGGHFYLNNQQLVEPYLDSSVTTKAGTFLEENKPQTVPADNYFVAGDNRPVSNDSRYIGFIQRDWIIGEPFVRIWPLNKVGWIK